MRLRTVGLTALWTFGLVLAGVLLYYYYAVDPSLSASAPKCTFKVLTGWDCPGCGSQRAFHALLHGHVAEAWGHNAFIFFALPIALFYAVVETGRRRWPRFHAASIHPAILLPLAAAIILWWIGRNVW